MGWEVLQQLRNRTIDWLQFRGSSMATAQTVRVLLKDRDNNAILARIEEGTTLPQKKRGFAKGCLLFADSTGPANQNTKGLYENVGTAKLSRFNVIGQVTDPEMRLPPGRILIGQSNGFAADIAMSGVIEINSSGVTSFSGTYAGSHRVVAAGITAAETDADAAVTITDANIDDQDVILATLAAAANAVYVTKAVCTVGGATITLSGNGGAGTQVNYVVYRPAGALPVTTAPPTTAAP